MRPLCVDAVALLGDKVVMIRRGAEPHKGMLALPGGHLEDDETAEQACLRELREETGLDGDIVRLVGVYSDPGRDPRGRVTLAYLVHARGRPRAGDDATDVYLVSAENTPSMAFDHARILRDALP